MHDGIEYTFSDKSICPGCIGDDFLKKLVAMAADADGAEESCSFCDSSPAADFNVLLDAFMVGVSAEYETADNFGVPWEGGYVWPTLDSWDLPGEFEDVFDTDSGEQVMAEVQSCIVEDAYISRHFMALAPHQGYTSAWQRFAARIKHHTRFVFWASLQHSTAPGEDPPELGELAVADVLATIGDLLAAHAFIATIPAGTQFIRLRGHETPEEAAGWAAADLGTNLPERATNATRMSPAGIPLFYGSSNVDTALAEVGHADGRPLFTSGTFELTASVTVVDLTVSVPIPSVFDADKTHLRGGLMFLRDLITELRKPLEHESRSHLDYVPTQVFCEYFLRIFDPKVRGVRWASAVAEGVSVALDIAHDDCVDAGSAKAGVTQLVRLAGSRHVYRRADTFIQVI